MLKLILITFITSLSHFLAPMSMKWDNNITPDPAVKEKDMRLHRGRTTGYYSGALMGNGLIGTNLYKLEDNCYRLNIGRSDVVEQRSPFSLFNSARLPIGYFSFSTCGKVTDEKMELSIYDAITSGSLTTDKGALSFSSYVHSTRNCVIFETEAKGDEVGYSWQFNPQKAVSPRIHAAFATPQDDYLNAEGNANPDGYRLSKRGIEYYVQPLVTDSTFSNVAKYYVVAWKMERSGDKSRVIATVSFEEKLPHALEQARKEIKSASRKGSEALKQEHTGWWHEFYENVAFLSFPDKEIEKFYWFQYYKFASCARPGKPVVDLQGVWPTVDTPWPAIWINLNIQLTYSWLTKANLANLAQPLWDCLWENRDNLTRNVTDIPGQESWTDSRVLPRAASYDFYSSLDPELAKTNQYEAGNLIWTLFYYWQQCEAYADDFQMTQRLFPLLKSAVNLFFHIRITNPDGSYSLPSTASPEYFTDREIGPNANYDLANLRWGLSALLEINEEYNLQDEDADKWQEFLDKLPDFQYDDKTGYKLSSLYEFEDTTHRHYSHLFMIYPYHQVDWSNPREAQKMELSVSRWNGNTGYSLTGKASMLESKGDGDAALVLLKEFFAKWLRPNTLYNEAGPVIETPFSAMCSLEEMYLQDWGDVIRVFYACPSEWKDCQFRNMRSRGGLLISATRKDGKTTEVFAKSEKGGTYTFWINGEMIKVELASGQEWRYSPSTARLLPLIPYPQSVVFSEGYFCARSAQVSSRGLSGKENALVESFAAILDSLSSVGAGDNPRGKIVFGRDDSLEDEAYRMEVKEDAINIWASSYSGTFYAIRTLQQLLPAGIYGQGIKKALSEEGARRHFAPGSEHASVANASLISCGDNSVNSGSWNIPCMEINDSPRFSYRGALLDCSRHFFTVESVKNFLRLMSLYKLNRFHWHLSNDAGWRAEIRRYPKLTKEGAFRGGIMTSHVKGLWRGGSHGGYYTQEQMREIVRFADSLAITVVPEICMPSHIEAALVAYPHLGCTGGPYQLRNKIGVYPEILCVGKESSFEFIEGVLEELCEIFPGEYFHIGGDECLKTRWEQCPHCQARIKELGLKDTQEWKAENYLQSYFTRRVQQILKANGKKMIGWDEILEGDIESGATVMSWRGVSGGQKAASKGMDVIMAASNYCYLDYIQSETPDIEPPSIGYYLPIENVYNFNPIEGLEMGEEDFVKGVQCQLWSEFIVTENHLHYMTLPRMLAISEVQWCQPSVRDYERFRSSVIKYHFPIFRRLGYCYCKEIEN